MNIFFYSKFSNQDQWIKSVKKKFKNHKIFTIKDKPNYNNIEVAIIFMMPDEKFIHLNSTVVKDVSKNGGDISAFVPPCVKKALFSKYSY